tara:strand:- start:92 stop:217 length:126 start_codon:yes stop_codon:yes gene_type:complete
MGMELLSVLASQPSVLRSPDALLVMMCLMQTGAVHERATAL